MDSRLLSRIFHQLGQGALPLSPQVVVDRNHKGTAQRLSTRKDLLDLDLLPFY